jgi:hypothetical protein
MLRRVIERTLAADPRSANRNWKQERRNKSGDDTKLGHGRLIKRHGVLSIVVRSTTRGVWLVDINPDTLEPEGFVHPTPRSHV